MSLRFFHIVFIVFAIALAAGTGVWSLNQNGAVFGAICLAASLALAVYAVWYVRKTKGQSLI